MTRNQHIVNAFPPDITPVRLSDLLMQYRGLLHDPTPTSPPDWYCIAIIDALEASLNARPVAS